MVRMQDTANDEGAAVLPVMAFMAFAEAPRSQSCSSAQE